jgi:hypothetical protein
MFEAAFNSFNLISCFLKTQDQFRHSSGFNVSVAQLTLCVVLAKGVDETLRCDQNSEIEAACDTFDLDFWRVE